MGNFLECDTFFNDRGAVSYRGTIYSWDEFGWNSACGLGEDIVNTTTQSRWIHLYLIYFMTGMMLSGTDFSLLKISSRWQMVIYGLTYILSLGIYAHCVKSSDVYKAPDQYYGKWYYTVWLVSMFLMLSKIKINHSKMQKVIARLSLNTFVVYLGHLPILLYITAIHPLKTTSAAVVFILIFFIGLETVAEIFRKMPLLRKLV